MTPPLTRCQQEPGQTKCQEPGFSGWVGGLGLEGSISLGSLCGFDDDDDVDVDVEGGAGRGAGIGVFGSIWQRTRTSLGLLQRVQFLR
jgi:hypothetical protein